MINEQPLADAAYLENAQRQRGSRHEKCTFFTHRATVEQEGGRKRFVTALPPDASYPWDATVHRRSKE